VGADAQRIDRQGQQLSGGKLPHHLHRITVQWHPGLLAEAMDGPHRLQNAELRASPGHADKARGRHQERFECLQIDPPVAIQRQDLDLPALTTQLISAAANGRMLKGRNQQPTRRLAAADPQQGQVVSLGAT